MLFARDHYQVRVVTTKLTIRKTDPTSATIWIKLIRKLSIRIFTLRRSRSFNFVTKR